MVSGGSRLSSEIRILMRTAKRGWCRGPPNSSPSPSASERSKIPATKSTVQYCTVPAGPVMYRQFSLEFGSPYFRTHVPPDLGDLAVARTLMVSVCRLAPGGVFCGPSLGCPCTRQSRRTATDEISYILLIQDGHTAYPICSIRKVYGTNEFALPAEYCS